MNMIRPQQLIIKRLFTSKTDFSKNCDWEEVLRQAKCVREAKQLDYVEECGMCITVKEKKICPPEEITDISPITGVPSEAYERNTAIINRPSKNVMQQGTANTRYYIMSYTNDVQWENPLMGWISGSNSLKDVEIIFPDKESALNFADRNGWSYIVPKEPAKKKIQKYYGENFSWNKRTRVSTK